VDNHLINLRPGNVVQINPDHDPVFGGTLMVVTEVKSWGAQGFVPVPANPPKMAYYRCNFEDMEFVGNATWTDDSEAARG